jgi:hypothetical protein
MAIAYEKSQESNSSRITTAREAMRKLGRDCTGDSRRGDRSSPESGCGTLRCWRNPTAAHVPEAGISGVGPRPGRSVSCRLHAHVDCWTLRRLWVQIPNAANVCIARRESQRFSAADFQEAELWTTGRAKPWYRSLFRRHELHSRGELAVMSDQSNVVDPLLWMGASCSTSTPLPKLRL